MNSMFYLLVDVGFLPKEAAFQKSAASFFFIYFLQATSKTSMNPL